MGFRDIHRFNLFFLKQGKRLAIFIDKEEVLRGLRNQIFWQKNAKSKT
jgi:hypothetical protein